MYTENIVISASKSWRAGKNGTWEFVITFQIKNPIPPLCNRRTTDIQSWEDIADHDIKVKKVSWEKGDGVHVTKCSVFTLTAML